MSRGQVPQRYIFKITTTRLKKAKWDLRLPLSEARRNAEVIGIGDSQMLRWIDELNGVTDVDERVRELQRQLRSLRRVKSVTEAKREIRSLYEELDRLLFKRDYIHLVIDRDKDLYKACKGFRVNGIRYVRLLGTSGGIKNSTIVFVNEKLAPVLRERIENGRNRDVPLVPAKFEAYRALTCSGSHPVSLPKGILVVPDCKTRFKEDVLYLTNEGEGEPEMRFWKDYDVELDESDGYGLMSPELAARWSEELGLDYVMSAANTRFAFEKGCAFTFDFHEFADRVAGKRVVQDAWGHDIDIGDVELVLTTSMLKLWNSYESIEHYLRCCEENRYAFAIAKMSPKKLENRRALNYQFLASYRLTDEQIDELVRPTIDEIRDILVGDYRKTLLFLGGRHMTDGSVMQLDSYIRALMIEPRLFGDPFIKRKVLKMVRKRIDDAKIGVLDVHGNYSILCGDPYALCQSMFGMDVTGLLRRGEIYNRYWLDAGANEVACYRAPMSCHNNILKRRIGDSEEIRHWYQHIHTCTLFNAWDDGCAALNGADKDGDIVFLTDNSILVDNIRPVPTLVCAQRSAAKKVVEEDDLIRSNIDGFGNEVGKVTNWITSMYDVQAQYPPGSPEFERLEYRIQCGQLFQQDTIDQTKGIISKPMPKYWHDVAAIPCADESDPAAMEEYELNRRIVANKKPYFMRYVYSRLMREYNTYMKNTNTKCLREFRMSLDELLGMAEGDRSDEQNTFIRYYNKRMPVGIHDCVMNRICRKVEAAFRDPLRTDERELSDYSFMKSGAGYTGAQYREIQKLYLEHCQRLKDNAAAIDTRTTSGVDVGDYRASLMEHFLREARKVCPGSDVLSDVVVDVCYDSKASRQFVWDVAGEAIVDNMLEANGGAIYYPVQDDDGDIAYGGDNYSMKRMEVMWNGQIDYE